ncbi:MAG: triose-phosphate isomerase [Patescibacteria group bacterium]|nr:triose-phosphate isomerase [Patescibacteria group bacterium]
MSQKIFIANWKMQLSPSEAIKTAKSFVKQFKTFKGTAVVCPDFLSLTSVSKIFKDTPLLLGAQDLAAFERGAYTGEISALDLAALNAKYVLIGHSERRSYLQETDKLLAAKIRMALAQKIKPVLCVGENAAEKKQGREAAVIKAQLKGALNYLSNNGVRSLLIAYEPIWAIGTGLNCNPEKALNVKNTILELCKRAGLKKTPILYGGSVTAENAADFLVPGGFDGLLVGGASLNAKSFGKIVKS